MELVFIGFSIFYLTTLSWYLIGFKKLPKSFPQTSTFIPSVSVIIAARNEQKDILRCLQSLLTPENQKIINEIIVVDDFSTDSTFELVIQMAKLHPMIKGIQTKSFPEFSDVKSPKKRAILCGLSVASGKWIALTDADCIVSSSWGMVFTDAISESSQMIAGPVEFITDQSLFSTWQHLEFAGLMLVAAGSVGQKKPSTINGANLWIKKEAFNSVGGFEGISHLISGDDELLMHKIHAKYPDGIQYLPTPEALVLTRPQPNLSSFWNQRKRWASKGLHYQSGSYKVFLAFFWLAHFLFLLLPFFALLGLVSWFIPFFIFLIKFFADGLFLSASNNFLTQKVNPFSVLWFGWIQIPYLVFTGLMGTFSRFEWKGVRY
ncbi:MAG: glycosyltransferase [Bacteroidetes bacterium]|nr:glycosyltransferase [Bacteroidota bacterium]